MAASVPIYLRTTARGSINTPGDTGIAVFADTTHNPIPALPPAAPIPRATIAANRISNEDVGIYTFGATKLLGLPSNKFDSSVGTPTVIN